MRTAKDPKDLYDVVVIGCGPAGTIVSLELCRLGYRVAAIGANRKFAAFEGVSERACEGFRYAGCQRALSVLGPEVRRIAHWNGESFEGNRERVVDRQRLDSALLQDITAAGVPVFNTRVKTITRDQKGWHFEFDGQSNVPVIASTYLIDARGRATPRGKSSWIVGPATMSLGRRWVPTQPYRAMTWLITFEKGWMWYATDGMGGAVAQVVVSTHGESLPPRLQLVDYFDSLLRIIPGMDMLLSEQRPSGAIHARDARTGLCREPISQDYARVGDAAFTIDPLSGHGMFEAIGGALALAPVVNTLFQHPRDADIAMDFYRDKLTVDFWRMARTGRDFYRQEQRWPKSPFWSERQSWPDNEPSHGPPGTARVEKRAVSDTGLIRMRDVVVTGDHPRGVWQIAGIPLVELMNFLKAHEDRSNRQALFAAAQYFETPREDIVTAIDWLRWRGLLDPKAKS